mmetsp:Transcript_50556/g.100599  ORF Transcript_50556/g.100599 Transcript_50556/m.100599 type:complete len:211 (-) Transcript_50556:1157-1789(-)
MSNVAALLAKANARCLTCLSWRTPLRDTRNYALLSPPSHAHPLRRPALRSTIAVGVAWRDCFTLINVAHVHPACRSRCLISISSSRGACAVSAHRVGAEGRAGRAANAQPQGRDADSGVLYWRCRQSSSERVQGRLQPARLCASLLELCRHRCHLLLMARPQLLQSPTLLFVSHLLRRLDGLVCFLPEPLDQLLEPLVLELRLLRRRLGR